MRYVKIVGDIQIVSRGVPWREGDGPWSMSRWIDDVVTSDPAMGEQTFELVTTCQIIGGKFEHAAPGTWVELDESNWQLLRKVVENPKGTIPMIVRRCLLPFANALIDAKIDKPVMDVVLEAKSEKPNASDAS